MTARGVTFRAASAVLGLLVALVLVEAVLRVPGLGPRPVLTKRTLRDLRDPWVEYHCYPSNPDGAFEPAPDVSEGAWELTTMMIPPEPLPLRELRKTPFCVEYVSSPQGLRDRRYTKSAAEGVVRILGIGDSFAYGEGVPLEQSLFEQMETLLGDGYEVVNAAVRGSGTLAQLQRLGQLAGPLGASRAIVVFIPNDIEIPEALLDREHYINDLILLRDEYLAKRERDGWYAGHLRSVALVGSYLDSKRIGRETIDWYRDLYDPAQNAKGLELLSRTIHDLARVPGCRVGLVIYPLMEGLEGEYPLAGIHDTVSSMARDAGLPVLDLAPAFRGRRTRSLWVHSSDHHPNREAHAIAAEAIVEWLKRGAAGLLGPT